MTTRSGSLVRGCPTEAEVLQCLIGNFTVPYPLLPRYSTIVYIIPGGTCLTCFAHLHVSRSPSVLAYSCITLLSAAGSPFLPHSFLRGLFRTGPALAFANERLGLRLNLNSECYPLTTTSSHGIQYSQCVFKLQTGASAISDGLHAQVCPAPSGCFCWAAGLLGCSDYLPHATPLIVASNRTDKIKDLSRKGCPGTKQQLLLSSFLVQW